MLLQMANFYYFLRLSSIPLYIYTTASLSIHLLMDSEGCFCILVIVNNYAMNTGVCVSFQIRVFIFFSDKYLEVELLGHMVILILVFLRKLHI